MANNYPGRSRQGSQPARPSKPAEYVQEANKSTSDLSGASSGVRKTHGSGSPTTSYGSPTYSVFPSPQPLLNHPPPRPPKVTSSGRSSESSITGVPRPYAQKVRGDSPGMIAELEGDMVGLGLSNVGVDKRVSALKKNRTADGMAEELVRQYQQPPGKRKIRVLSLDGGGIRGYSSLVILGDLMHRVHVLINRDVPVTRHALPRPCDFFDIIGGNGTGGLIALMLGRMRMDVETCKEYYEALTRYVFVTDKTILGMPYGNTLFKASRLEEAIKVCVRECTLYDHLPLLPYLPAKDKNGANSPPPIQPTSTIRSTGSRKGSWGKDRPGSNHDQVPTSTFSSFSSSSTANYHDHSRFSKGSDYSSFSAARGRSAAGGVLGNPDTLLYDHRVGACKTFVTTTYMGSPRGAPSVLLRSYRTTRDTTAVSEKATIWEAGRATCATKAAFKPVTIANVQFQDEGYGKYNPASYILDEALARETWHDVEDVTDDDKLPGIGVFVSIGTGKRFSVVRDDGGIKPGGLRKEKSLWWESMGVLEQYAEAKKRLIEKLEDCETVHLNMQNHELAQKGVDKTNYYRFNVEVGVGEFGMNEWNRLAEVSTGTRRYLARADVEKNMVSCAGKLVNIWRENEQRGKFKDYQRQLADGGIVKEIQPPVDEDEMRRKKERARRRAARAAAQNEPISPTSPTTIAELEADIDRVASEWSSPKSSYHTGSQTASGSDGEYGSRQSYEGRQSYEETSPRHQHLAHDNKPPAPQQPSYFSPPLPPPPQRTQAYEPPNVSQWVQQLQTHRQVPIPIPSPKDFLPPKIVTSPPSAPPAPPMDLPAAGPYSGNNDPINDPYPEIRVTSPTTVAGDETPPGTPRELRKARSIEGDRIARREKRVRKLQKGRESVTAAERNMI